MGPPLLHVWPALCDPLDCSRATRPACRTESVQLMPKWGTRRLWTASGPSHRRCTNDPRATASLPCWAAMRRLSPLPDHLVRSPATRTTLLAEGLRPSEIRGRLWGPLHRGVRAWSHLPPDDAAVRVRAAALVLPEGGALTGWGAAWVHGATTLDGAGRPVEVTVPTALRVRRPELRVRHSALGPGDLAHRDGLPVTSPTRCAFDLARYGWSDEEAVVGLDVVLAAGLVSLAGLRAYVAAHPGWRGVPRARRACSLADPAAESPMETRLRMLWLEAGLPAPRANVDVGDARGRFLGRVDLLDEEAGLVGEYDRADHRTATRHAADNRREEPLEAVGLTVTRFVASDVWGARAAARARLQAAWHRAMARDRSCDAWTLPSSSTP